MGGNTTKRASRRLKAEPGTEHQKKKKKQSKEISQPEISNSYSSKGLPLTNIGSR
jgi:hypothetical protein